MTLERDVSEILYAHPMMKELRAVRDGLTSIADEEGTSAVMEHIMAIEEALKAIAKRVDRPVR